VTLHSVSAIGRGAPRLYKDILVCAGRRRDRLPFKSVSSEWVGYDCKNSFLHFFKLEAPGRA
jgi:hypothetical protein